MGIYEDLCPKPLVFHRGTSGFSDLNPCCFWWGENWHGVYRLERQVLRDQILTVSWIEDTPKSTPKWMVYKGKSYWNGWFRGTPPSGNLHIFQVESETEDDCYSVRVEPAPVRLFIEPSPIAWKLNEAHIAWKISVMICDDQSSLFSSRLLIVLSKSFFHLEVGDSLNTLANLFLFPSWKPGCALRSLCTHG